RGRCLRDRGHLEEEGRPPDERGDLDPLERRARAVLDHDPETRAVGAANLDVATLDRELRSGAQQATFAQALLTRCRAHVEDLDAAVEGRGLRSEPEPGRRDPARALPVENGAVPPATPLENAEGQRNALAAPTHRVAPELEARLQERAFLTVDPDHDALAVERGKRDAEQLRIRAGQPGERAIGDERHERPVAAPR